MTKFIKHSITTVIIGILAYGISTVVWGGFKYENSVAFFTDVLIYQCYAFIIGFSNITFFDVWKRSTWYKKTPVLRIGVGLLGLAVITVIGFVLLTSFIVTDGSSLKSGQFVNDSSENYKSGLWLTLAIVGMYLLIHVYNEYQKNKLKEQKVIATAASAQFESLKNQIDPHFLFNSLNVLSSLIEENPDNAQQFTVSLSKIYRYVLEQKDKELVLVTEELTFAKTYMNLLKMRFENSVHFDYPEYFNDQEAKVVPLSLQLLLENTIKHNMVSETKPLYININIENNYLVVQNNKQKKEVLQTRKGVGLQNIVNRYGILTNRPVLIDETDAFFKVKIPILTKQITSMETKHRYNEQDAYERARKRVEAMKGFYISLLSYCVVIPILIVINYKTYWEFKWFWFPMLGWGLGVIFHAFEVFGYGKRWEERKIRQLLEKEQQTKTWH